MLVKIGILIMPGAVRNRRSMKRSIEMNNEKTLDKIYGKLDKLIDDYADLPETKEAEERFWEYARKNILQDRGNVEERELESALYDVAYFNEKQGFKYGFNYALEIMGGLDLLNYENKAAKSKSLERE